MSAGVLSFYGGYQYVDYFQASTTPICADFVNGCECNPGVSNCTDTICGNSGDTGGSFTTSFKMSPGVTGYVYSWTGAPTCEQANGAGPFNQNDVAEWNASSLANSQGVFNFPNTVIDTYQSPNADSEPAQAYLWLQKLTIKGGGMPLNNCYPSADSDGEAWWTAGNTACTGPGAGGSMACCTGAGTGTCVAGEAQTPAYAIAITDMLNSCVSNH